MSNRIGHRLALAGALVAIVGLVRGLDTGMIVALALAVMEADTHLSPWSAPPDTE